MGLVQLRRAVASSNVPSSLEAGEIAINEFDRLLFTRDGAGAVKATSLDPLRILGVYHEQLTTTATRTDTATATSFTFAAIPVLSATAKLIVSWNLHVSAGDNSSNIAGALQYLALWDGVSWGSEDGDLAGIHTQGNQGNVVAIRQRIGGAQLLENSDAYNDNWTLGINTACQTSGVDCTWSRPQLTAWQIEGGDIN